MNSFSTSDDTKAHLSKSHKDLLSEEDVELASLCICIVGKLARA